MRGTVTLRLNGQKTVVPDVSITTSEPEEPLSATQRTEILIEIDDAILSDPTSSDEIIDSLAPIEIE